MTEQPPEHDREQGAVTEAIFRQVNENVESLNRAFGELTGDFTVVCECANEECLEQILMQREDYERIRADATQFIVRPGHSVFEIEAVVEEGQEWLIVRKRPGAPERLAKAIAP